MGRQAMNSKQLDGIRRTTNQLDKTKTAKFKGGVRSDRGSYGTIGSGREGMYKGRGLKRK